MVLWHSASKSDRQYQEFEKVARIRWVFDGRCVETSMRWCIFEGPRETRTDAHGRTWQLIAYELIEHCQAGAYENNPTSYPTAGAPVIPNNPTPYPTVGAPVIPNIPTPYPTPGAPVVPKNPTPRNQAIQFVRARI